ncbi:mutator type transposase [Tanacetum coccineum]
MIHISVVDVQEDDLDVIDYDSFGSDLDDRIDSERRIQQVRVRCEGTIPALVPYVAIDKNMDKNVFSQTKGGPAIRENINSGKQNISDHVIKSLATNPDIPVRAVQDQMQKQFEVGVSKKAFRAKRIASDIMTSRYREQHINENMKSQFKGCVDKEMLWNAAKATSEGEFKKKLGRAKCDLLINNICKVFNRKWELTGIPCKHVVAALYNMSENSIGVGHQRRGISQMMRLQVKVLHQASFLGRASQSVVVNVSYNRKGCRGQGGGSSQAGARKVSGQAAGLRKVSGQAAGARNISGQAAGARKASS